MKSHRSATLLIASMEPIVHSVTSEPDCRWACGNVSPCYARTRFSKVLDRLQISAWLKEEGTKRFKASDLTEAVEK